MQNCHQVSVIILSYNPKIEKMCRTIRSIIGQKNINFEVVVSDDGSTLPEFDKIEHFFYENNFKNYKIVKNKKNEGTVKNCLAGLQYATGEYIFLTSAGDMLYDQNTLRDFYVFSKKKKTKVCFGDVIYYSYDKKEIKIHDVIGRPARPQLYLDNYSFLNQKVEFFYEDMILGAAFFREREFAKKYFQKIEKSSKYVEDGTSTLYALADNIKIEYYNRNIVWYEYGSGVSTGKNKKWLDLLKDDYDNTFIELKKKYPKDAVVDAGYMRRFYNKTLIEKLIRLIRHPLIAFIHFKNKRIPLSMSGKVEYDRNILNNLLL